MNITHFGTGSDSSVFAATSSPVGSKKPIKVDISSADFPITVPIRMLTAITGTVIVVDMACVDGEITGVKVPPNIPIFNVTNIVKTGTDATDIIAWPVE
jgi:hypothetical protein